MSKILVCDHDPARARAVSAALSGDGHRVSVVDELGRFAEAYRTSAPDLLVLETRIPGGGSDMALKFLANLGQLGKVPLVFCGEEEDAPAIERLPAFIRREFFGRPLDMDGLRECVALLLAAARPKGAGPKKVDVDLDLDADA